MDFSQDRKRIQQHQVDRLRQMLQVVLTANCFYQKKIGNQGLSHLASHEVLKGLPFTTKSELVQDQANHHLDCIISNLQMP